MKNILLGGLGLLLATATASAETTNLRIILLNDVDRKDAFPGIAAAVAEARAGADNSLLLHAGRLGRSGLAGVGPVSQRRDCARARLVTEHRQLLVLLQPLAPRPPRRRLPAQPGAPGRLMPRPQLFPRARLHPAPRRPARPPRRPRKQTRVVSRAPRRGPGGLGADYDFILRGSGPIA